MSVPHVKLKLVQGRAGVSEPGQPTSSEPTGESADAPGSTGPDFDRDVALAMEAAVARAPGSGADQSGEQLARAEFVQQLFADHRVALLRYLTRLLSNSADAEELVQETYIRLLRVEYLEQLDDQVRRFLFKIATNLARDRIRQRKARSFDSHVPCELDELVGEQAPPEEVADWDAGLKVIKQVLLDLPPRYRRVFLLHVTENMSYRAIARHLDVSTKTVERDIAMVLELCQGRLRTMERR
jgi:RNA polymerase sigma factor CnrH